MVDKWRQVVKSCIQLTQLLSCSKTPLYAKFYFSEATMSLVSAVSSTNLSVRGKIHISSTMTTLSCLVFVLVACLVMISSVYIYFDVANLHG